MSRTKLRILFLEFEYEVLCRLQAESEAVMGLINKEKTGSILPIMAMDSISDAGPDALKITGLVKSGGTVTGYQLSDGRIVSRKSGVELAKENQIQGVGIAHNKDTEYLKSIPDGTQDNNLSHLPTVHG